MKRIIQRNTGNVIKTERNYSIDATIALNFKNGKNYKCSNKGTQKTESVEKGD